MRLRGKHCVLAGREKEGAPPADAPEARSPYDMAYALPDRRQDERGPRGRA